MRAGKAIVFVTLSAAIVGLAFATPAFATEEWISKERKKGKKAVARTLKEAAKRFSREVVESAKKWAKTRNVPAIDILTTILLESRGNPKAHAFTSKEDSRGLMQVNVRAHADLLKSLGYTPEDLYKVDVGVEVGSYLLAQYRKRVMEIVKAVNRPQEYTLDILTRLYYAGPKYTETYIRTGKPFKNMDTYIEHWKQARQAVAAAMAEGGAYA